MLQAIERECGTIKESMWELHDQEGTHRISMSQASCPCRWDYATTWLGWEVTIGITVHDKMSNLRQKGVGDQQLRHEVRTRFGTICRQSSINGSNVGGTVKFEFKKPYKSKVDIQRTTLSVLRIQLLLYQVGMNLINLEALRVSSVFDTLLKETQDLLNRMMSTTEEAT